ncbi:MAG: CHASE2 domain-containing protein [Betaproteobacteria bacterium]
MTVTAPETPALRTARLRIAGTALVAVFAIVLLFDLPRTLPLREAFFDSLQQAMPRRAETTPVTIVEIDDRSIAGLGRWPWPRTLLAELVRVIAAHGPAAIGVDVVMSEADPLSPERTLARVGIDRELQQRLAALPTNDATLAAAFKAAPVVIVIAGLTVATGEPLHVQPVFIRDASGTADAVDRARARLTRFAGALASLPVLSDAASGAGLINGDDSQGIVRRVPLVADVNGTLAPAFALELWRVALGARAIRVVTSDGSIESAVVANQVFATESDGSVRPYFARRNGDRSVSAVDVLEGRVPADRLRRSFVLIGVSALALGDNLWTPLAEKMPGVELHAQLLENMDADAFLRRPAWAPIVEALAFVVLGGLLIGSMPRWSVRSATLIALAGVTALVLASFTLFQAKRLLLDAATPGVAIALLFGTLLAMTLASATRNRKALQDVVQQQREASARVEGELQAARRIQLDTLPRPESLQEPRVELAAFMEPALEVGGDLYDFYRLDEGRVFFMLGDVSGKGLPASIFMAVSKALCKSTVLRSRDADLGVLLAQTNAEVSRDNPAALFVTAFVGVLDARTGELDYCNAGQENPWLVSPDRGRVARLTDGDGPPLCAVDAFEYAPARVQLRPGDVLCLVSDGVTEAQNAASELYGPKRAERVLETTRTAGEAVMALRRDVVAFAGGAAQSDDQTVLALQWRGPSPAAGG